MGTVTTDTATTVQAIGAAVSALSAALAVGLALLTVRQAGRERADRQHAQDRALERDQLRAIVLALDELQAAVDGDTLKSLRGVLELARAQLAVVLALRPIDLPAARVLVSDRCRSRRTDSTWSRTRTR
jgi:hypothetical protein